MAAALLPIGALGSRFGMWPFTTGVMLLAGGAVLAAIGLVTGIAGIVAAHHRGLAADRPAVYLGALVSALVLGVMGLQFYTASRVPPTHDISTNVIDPPQFDVLAAERGGLSNSLEYTPEKANLQAVYGFVKTLESPLPRSQALARSQSVLEDMGLEVVSVDEEAGRVEATATTFWFGFKDDMVVRVQAGAQGSLVDARSVSRVGVSDLGANARRIGEFLTAFNSE